MLHGLAAMRMIKYLYAKLLYLFGLASNNPKLAEAVWSQVQVTVNAVHFENYRKSDNLKFMKKN